MLDLSFGQAGDVPVPGDYDGDGRADLAVFRPSTAQWVILPSGTGQATFGQFGLATDVPVPGDYDGDGRTDVAVFRPSSAQWWIRPSQSGVAYPVTFGLATDSLVPADYDGDGRTDLAVFRPASGAWWIQRSSTSTIEQRNWGSATDVPVPADYDGDGAADAAIFRPGTAEWWVKESSTQNQVQVRFGLGTDTPLPGRYTGGDRDRIAVLRAALLPQSITFTSTAPVEAPLGGTYDVAATGGGSGNPVTFSSSTPLVCTIDGSTVAFVALGSCVIAANQAGGGGFEAAMEVTQSMAVVLPFTFAPPTLPPPALNGASAGSVVRISFDLGGNRGLAVLAPQSPASAPVSCTPPHAATGPSVATKGAGGGLTYAASSGLYTYAWKTEKAWRGTCREIVLQLIDGTSRSAIYQFR
jgi:hypothetical protein